MIDEETIFVVYVNFVKSKIQFNLWLNFSSKDKI